MSTTNRSPESLIREEGAAARILGVPRERNPYARCAELGMPAEWSAMWLNGWAQGRAYVQERLDAAEQRENVARLFAAERRGAALRR
jgi:hypothetical protein